MRDEYTKEYTGTCECGRKGWLDEHGRCGRCIEVDDLTEALTDLDPDWMDRFPDIWIAAEFYEVQV